jgi:phosphatidyl-myo-inositol dimannoside synthase
MGNKLLVFSYDFPPSNGGIARLCQEIAVGQQEYFEQVNVLTRKKVGESNPYNFDKVQIIELPNKRIQCEKAAFNYLRKIRDKEEYTILCGVWHPEAALSILAGFKNVFILGHGTEFLAGESAFRKYFWLPIYAKWILGKAKLNIANSTYTKGLIHEINPKAKVVALPLGVNEDFFKPSELKNSDNDILKIVTVSRIEQFKGYDFIAKTIANLPEEYKNKIHWNIGGTGPYLQNLQELVRKLGIEKNVTFYGFILDERLPAFYNSNDIFVLCTRENKASTQVEGFGLVFLEAQACGIPVIGTKTGGIADAIENENGGWLIEQDNQIQLTNILIKCFQDKKIMVNQGKIARLRVEQNCTWKLYNNKLFNFLQN